MEKINMTEVIDNKASSEVRYLLAWSLLHLITKHNIDPPRDAITNEVVVDTVVTINGVEVKLSELLEKMCELFSDAVRLAATDLLDKHLNRVVMRLNAVTDEFDNAIQLTIKESVDRGN